MRDRRCALRFSQTLERRLDEIEPGQIAAILEAQGEKGRAQLKANNLSIEDMSVAHVADMSYAGRIHSLRVPIQRDWPAARMREAFLEAYRQEFGNTLGEIPVVIVNLRTAATGKRGVAAPSTPMPVSQGAPTPRRRRQVHFGVRATRRSIIAPISCLDIGSRGRRSSSRLTRRR